MKREKLFTHVTQDSEGTLVNEKPGPKLHALGSHLRDTLDKVKPQTEYASVVARIRGNGGKSDYEGAA